MGFVTFIYLFIFVSVVRLHLSFCACQTDTEGNERFHSLMPLYYRGAGIVIVGFDVTNLESLTVCDRWIEELKSKKDYFKGVIVAVGNKIDLIDQRKISTEEAQEHFKSMDPPIPYFETSAKTGEGVNELFESAVAMWLDSPLSSLAMRNDNNTEVKPRSKCSIQ